MNGQLKKAPYFDNQPNDPASEVIALVGKHAFHAYGTKERKGRGEEWLTLSQCLQVESGYIPLILGEAQLQEINRLRLLKENARAIRFCLLNDNELSEAQKTALCLNVAKHSKACLVTFADHIGQVTEDASGYIQRLRADSESQQRAERIGEIVADTEAGPPHDKASDKELIIAFLNWLDKPIGRDIEMGETLEYNGIYWQRLHDEMLVRKVMQYLDELDRDYTTTRLNRLAELARNKAELIPPQNRHLIGFKNGVIDKQTGQFYAHRRDFFLRHIENYACDPESLETPNFDRWLAFVSDRGQEKEQAILAGLFMILTNRNDWHLFLEITGKARSGKSVMAEIASVINGEINTAVITLKDMDEPTKRAMLLNKSLAYSPDQGYYKGDGSALKKITANDPVEVKLLYMNSFKARLGVVFMMTTNEAMLFTDRNGGVAERRVIIPFNRQVPFEQRDPQLMGKIQVEVFGIINKLLASFPEPQEARAILNRYKDLNRGEEIKRSSNHLIDFVSYFELSNHRPKGEALLLGSARRVNFDCERANTLYAAYYLYCQCNNIKELNLLSFRHALADAFKEAGQPVDYVCKKSNGFMTTNAYWKNKRDAIREWTSEEPPS